MEVQMAQEINSLDSAEQWLNSEPLTAAGLQGRVVLVQFCTYTCINWIRTLPYVRAWADRYGDDGLVVVGVHTPEFSFEHDLDNIREALEAMDVRHPIVVDNDYAIWNAFGNRYWPALYFVDAGGRTRHWHFGESAYEESERVIQQLLSEGGASELGSDVVSVEGRGVEAAPAWHTLDSPETYVGYERAANFASPGGASPGEAREYTAPPDLRLNEWALSGDWKVEPEGAILSSGDGSIEHRFHSRDLHLVMGPPRRGTEVRFRVQIDGQPPDGAHGVDVDADGNGVARGRRLYQLVRQPGEVSDRTFRITFLDPGVEAYSFTFG
jgi:thiol-disulfide isomerase/thioredoxin